MTASHNKLFYPFIFFIGCMLLLSACQDEEPENPNLDECSALSQLGSFECLPASLPFIPYEDGTNQLIFSDSSGKEYIGNVMNYRTEYYSARSVALFPCSLDPSLSGPYFWRPKIKAMQLQIYELDIDLVVALEPVMSSVDYTQKQTADICTFWLYTPLSSKEPNATLPMVVNARNSPEYQGVQSPKLAEFTFHGYEYKDVYYNTPSKPDEFQLYYNAEFGIIGFENASTGISVSIK